MAFQSLSRASSLEYLSGIVRSILVKSLTEREIVCLFCDFFFFSSRPTSPHLVLIPSLALLHAPLRIQLIPSDNLQYAINSPIVAGITYSRASDRFHQWKTITEDSTFGLNFQSPEEASAFAGAMEATLAKLGPAKKKKKSKASEAKKEKTGTKKKKSMAEAIAAQEAAAPVQQHTAPAQHYAAPAAPAAPAQHYAAPAAPAAPPRRPCRTCSP